MTPDMPRPTGLKPTIRQWTIFVLWAAAMFATLRALVGLRLFGFTPEAEAICVVLWGGVFVLPILGVLIGLFDRAGPVRDWYRTCCLAAACVVPGVLFLLQEPANLVLTGELSPVAFMAIPAPFVAAICLWVGWRQWQLVRPRPCVRCGHRAVIPVKRPAWPGATMWIDTGRTGWCATCGTEYQRADTAGPWQPVAGTDAPAAPGPIA